LNGQPPPIVESPITQKAGAPGKALESATVRVSSSYASMAAVSCGSPDPVPASA
jgi:hypothetical protein